MELQRRRPPQTPRQLHRRTPHLPPGSIEITSRDQSSEPSSAGAWSAPVPLGWKARATPALASYRGNLYTVFPQAADNRLVWSRHDGAAWTAPRIIGSAASDQPCALAVHQDHLHLMYTGGDGKIYHGWFNTQEWSPLRPVSNWRSGLGPALAELDGVLWSAHTGGNRAYVSSYISGTTWNTAEIVGGSREYFAAHSAPGLGKTLGRICVDYRATDSQIMSRESPYAPGRPWTESSYFQWKTRHAPTVHHAGAYDWMAHVGLDGRAYLTWRDTHTNADQHKWKDPAEVIQLGTRPCIPLAAPALTTHNGRLYAIYHA